MKESDKHSRFGKFEKRRKNTKLISILIVIGSFLLILLIAIWIFGGKDKNITDTNEQASENQNAENNIDTNDNGINVSESDNHSEENGDESDSNESNTMEDDETDNNTEQEAANDAVETEDTEPSGDNVIEAYTGNWQPIGTEQQGPHTTIYEDESQDRIEIKQGVISATNLSGGNMIEWRVENGGDQKVVATVSDSDETDIYRVYLSWIDEEGWQPTKVEELRENDKK